MIILGSTGSVGQQALEVVDSLHDQFEVYALSCHQNTDLLIQQAKKFLPDCVVVSKETDYEKVKTALWEDDVKVYFGAESLNQIVSTKEVDIVLNALIGFAGLEPTLSAIEANKRVALANKESLVVAGPLIAEKLKKSTARLVPIDSEHSAIFQCLLGEFDNPIEKIILTASGGPFRGKLPEELEMVQPQQAISHPTWKMGAKISVDSATMINKGFEMIEAQWLFGLKPAQIELLIHPESLVHSMVQFEDGSVKAQMGATDMKGPIQYALCYPERIKSSIERIDFSKIGQLNFSKVETSHYPNLELAIQVLNQGGILPCALNASNEIAVQAFLIGKITFNQIYEVNQKVFLTMQNKAIVDLNTLKEVDINAREKAKEFIGVLQTDLR